MTHVRDDEVYCPGITCTTLMTMTHHQAQQQRPDHAHEQQTEPGLLPQRLALGGIVHPLMGMLVCAVGVRIRKGGDDGRDVEEGTALCASEASISRWIL